MVAAGTASAQASGGEHLSSTEVSSLPLNVRDFSKLLLLAAGTMTDANGAANFTQQFAVNGQRGVATVFAMDGFDTTDPEMGGATFSNFNVDAIQEVQANSGVMPAEIGHGAASFTNVVTKSGVNLVHGSLFEFLRNAAFDARNYFDYKDPTGQRRIPPFVRNEFGFTNGGPVVIPGIYDGRNRTFYFGEYQGFRQVLGTTQVMPVPTAAERQGIDTTTFPGDTLTVPVNAEVLPVLNGYPLPNQPSGAFGDRTYATSSKVIDADRPILGANRSPDFGQGFAGDAVQPEPGDGAADQSRSDGDQSQFWSAVFRSPAECGRAIYADDLSASDVGNFSELHSQHAVFSGGEPHAAGDQFRRRFISGVQFAGGIDFWIVQQSLSVQAGHGVGARIACLQVGSRNTGQPRLDDFWDESEWDLRVRRRHGIFAGADQVGERDARHSAGRSAA